MDIRSLNAPAVKCEGKSLEKIENSIYSKKLEEKIDLR